MFPDDMRAKFYDQQVLVLDQRMKRERRWLRWYVAWHWILTLGGIAFFGWAVLDVYGATIGGQPLMWINAASHALVGWCWAVLFRKRHLESIAKQKATLVRIRLDRGFARLQADLYRPEVSDASDEAR